MSVFFVLILPLISIITLCLNNNRNVIRYLPILISTLSLGIIFQFVFKNQLISESTFDSLYVNFYSLLPIFDVNMSFKIDRISVLLLFLSQITIITAFFSTLKIASNGQSLDESYTRLKQINIWISFISIGICGLIISSNLFVFFLFYEVAAVPIFLMISTWGYNLKREVSGPFQKILKHFNVGTREYGSYKITIYLFVASILIFFGLAILGISAGSFEIMNISNLDSYKINSNLVFWLLLIGFGTHSALWPFHTWAPDGHGTAPTAGSIIFAGILMKIGVIGFIKILIPLMNEITLDYSNLIITLASINIVYGAFTALRQDDLKYVAAYASLSHIGYIFLALMTNNKTGIDGAIFQIISHGLIICLLFFTVGVIYRIKGTRLISELNSMLDSSPILSSFFIFSAFASIGFPLTSGFVSEFMIINGIYKSFEPTNLGILLICIPTLGILLTTVYMFRAVKDCFITLANKIQQIIDMDKDEIIICFVLCFFILFIGLFPSIIQDILNESYKGLVMK